MEAGQAVINLYSNARVDAVTTPTTACYSGTLNKGSVASPNSASPFSGALESGFATALCTGFNAATPLTDNFLFVGMKDITLSTPAILKVKPGEAKLSLVYKVGTEMDTSAATDLEILMIKHDKTGVVEVAKTVVNTANWSTGICTVFDKEGVVTTTGNVCFKSSANYVVLSFVAVIVAFLF
jgi:hypothetical protein